MLRIDVTAEKPGFALDVDLRIEADRIAITGPSGAGKTTLLRAVAGLEETIEGRIAFRDEVWRSTDGRRVPAWDRGVGWLPQDALVFPHLDALGNLRYADPDADHLERIVRALELEDRLEVDAHALSGGERQRVALGRALLSNPRLLLLDEPFSALDRRLTSRVCAFLDDWCGERDCRLLVAAHAAEPVRGLVDEVRRMADGRFADPDP